MFLGTLDPASNRADWELTVQFTDSETGEALDISGASIVVEVRDRRSGAILITASTANASVSIVDTGMFQISVPVEQMRLVRADTHEVGGTYTLNAATKQFAIGLLPVLDGIVT